MPRLQLDPDEKITIKEYLRRKRKQEIKTKKRSKISYIMGIIVILLGIYVFSQFYVYSKTNNFKYVDDHGVRSQKVYNVYYVTEGYTYNPVYSLNSIHSDGFEDKLLFQNSGMYNIKSSKDYVYGIKDNKLYRYIKKSSEIEVVVDEEVIKYILGNDRVYYITKDNNSLKYIDLNSKSISNVISKNVEEVLIDSNYIYTVQDADSKRVIVKYDLNGGGKQDLVQNENVSYIVQDDTRLFFVNKKDSNSIYVVNKDGTNLAKVDNIATVSDKGIIEEIDGTKYMFISKNYLFFVNTNDSSTLWKINLENKEKTKVIASSVSILQNVDDTIFYKVKNEIGAYLYNYETGFISSFTNRNVTEFSIDASSDAI